MNQFLAALGPFGLGLLNMTNPCILPLYPGFIAYLAGNQSGLQNRQSMRWLGVTALAGVLTSMAVVGLAITLLQVAIGKVLALLLPLLYGLLIVLGILMFFKINPFERLPMLRSPRMQSPLLTSFVYGLLYGPMTLPCSGALILGVFAYSTTSIGSLIDAISYVIAFGLGFGLPLLILPLLADSTRKVVLQTMLKHHNLLTRGAGILLIIIGLTSFAKDWALIRSNWGF